MALNSILLDGDAEARTLAQDLCRLEPHKGFLI